MAKVSESIGKKVKDLSSCLYPLVEIIVNEKLEKGTKYDPRVYVSLEFGLNLRVGDVLLFNAEDEDPPRWVESWTNYEQLFDFGIVLTQRVFSEQIKFYAKRG